MDRRKPLIPLICIVLLLAGMLYVGSWETFDAKGFVQAILDETFQGDVTKAASMIQDQTAAELKAHYEKGVEEFLDKNIFSGVEVDEATREKYKVLCQDIFKCMKYEVKHVKMLNRKKMEVTVEYRQADIFPQFVRTLNETSEQFLKDAANAKYKKTKQNQIEAQIEKAYLNYSYKLLKEAYENVTYDEPETMVFVVEGDKNNSFSLKEEQISELIVKILMIDEIKD